MCDRDIESRGMLSTLELGSPQAPAFDRSMRWGYGMEHLKNSGSRVFFPEGFVPKCIVAESLKAFAHTQAQIDNIIAKGFEVVQTQSMAADHAAALYAFTLEEPRLYHELNRAMRSTASKRQIAKYRDYIYHLDRASNNLRNVVGKVYRGINKKVDVTPGNTITWQSFSSSSRRCDVAMGFAHTGYSNLRPGALLNECTIFVINAKSAKDIAPFSAFKNEQEALFPMNTQFRVTRKLEGSDKKNELRELASYCLDKVDVYMLDEL